MQLLLKKGYSPVIIALAMLMNSPVIAQSNTEGTLTFTVETMSNGGNYSPRHVLSIWIEDASGFVKTCKLRADRRIQYLYTWNNQSSKNSVDAVTGATLSSHQSHTITWDCTDVDGNVVPDGDYKVRVEFTDAHAQGPLYSLTFSKGTDEVSESPSNQGKFKNISLVWEPDIVVTPEADFSYVAEDLTVTFTNNSTNADSYNWDFGDGSNSTDTDPVHAYTAADTYHVVLEATGGDVTVTSEQDITVTDGVTMVVEKEGVFKVYPNPAYGQLIIEKDPALIITGYEIVSLDGKRLINATVKTNSKLVIGLNTLSNGSYVLILKGPDKDHTFTFVKE